jgi:hypothetical protein
VPNPDLTKVDEVGFVDLMPGSGTEPAAGPTSASSKSTASQFRVRVRKPRRFSAPVRNRFLTVAARQNQNEP